MKGFFIVVLILALACFGIYHFYGEKMFWQKPAVSGSATDSKSVNTTGDTQDNRSAEKVEGKNVIQKVDEWRKMVAEMRTVLNNIKDLQEKPLQGKQ